MSVRDWFIAPRPAASEWAPPVEADPDRSPALRVSGRQLSCAAVLGRPGEAEPVAAAVALALREPAATVIVVGQPPPPADAEAVGTRAARRLVARVAAHGLDASPRGRLAWTHAPPEAAARAALAGAPAVLAITAPLNAILEAAVARQDLAVVVAPDPEGPLARLAVASLEHLGTPILTAAPLGRGLARRLANAGFRTPRAASELLGSVHGEGG
jgi:hypothetical protein